MGLPESNVAAKKPTSPSSPRKLRTARTAQRARTSEGTENDDVESDDEAASKSAEDDDGELDEDESPDSVDVVSEIEAGDALADDEAFIDTEGEATAVDDDGDFAPPRTSRAIAKVKKPEGVGRLDPLETYMREIQAHPLLTPEQEKELAVRYAETQDVDAAARLVTANLRLVVKLAYEYRRAYRNMMDLVQEGNMGLMQAVKKYDPYRGVKLSSYAAWWIRAYMLRFILSNWRMVKLGTTQAQRKLFFNLNKERARLSAQGIEPTNAQIATSLDVTETEVDEMDRRLSRGDASLDTPVNEADGRQTARVEMMAGAGGSSPDTMNEGAELSHMVRKNLDEFRLHLSGKDLVIFDERLVADEPRTLQDLGDQFGVSRERVRQLEARLTGKLRTFLSERLGDAVEVA